MSLSGGHEVLGHVGGRTSDVCKVRSDDTGKILDRYSHEAWQSGVLLERNGAESAARVGLRESGEEGVEFAVLAVGAIRSGRLMQVPARLGVEESRCGLARVTNQMRLRPRPGFLGSDVVESGSIAAGTGTRDPDIAHGRHCIGNDGEDILEVIPSLVVDRTGCTGVGDNGVTSVDVTGAVRDENVMSVGPRILPSRVSRS